MTPRNTFFKLTFAALTAMILTAIPFDASAQENRAGAPKVDFSYAFAAPHRITIGRPDASERTLLDLQPGSLGMKWGYEDLSMPNHPPLAYKPPPRRYVYERPFCDGIAWCFNITPQIDGHAFGKSSWTRLEAFLPALNNLYEDSNGSLRLQALGGTTAALFRIEVVNSDTKPHQFLVRGDSGNAWGQNPAWMDPSQFMGDNLVAGYCGRADRVLVFGTGADSYSLQSDGLAPGYNRMVLVFNLKPGEKCVGWFVRPYNAFAEDLPELRKHDWAKEWEQCKKEWHELLDRALKLSIPDSGVTNAYRACLGDLFIMREPMSNGLIGNVVGTEQYRSSNPLEPAIVAVALDQNGMHNESAVGYKVNLDMQKSDGNWADYQGWAHLMWAASGFKCWAIMEHYRITGDKQYLAEMYPRMIASSRFQEQQRKRTRTDENKRSMTYGLMPRGMGDGGLSNEGDLYGVFFTHNIWPVYADRCSLEAAEILGKTEDVAELKKIYETARTDLQVALDRGAIKEKDYRWIPGVPGKTSGSVWGSLNIAYPCGLLPVDHELVGGTLRHIEANISKGGLALGLGWMGSGVWMAMSLDNVAETHLARGNGDAAAKYLYAVLNHGTPLYTWCEERGQEPGSAETSGDRQHEWTPVAMVRLLRDMMVMESGDGLNLALGTSRHWLASGKPVGITSAPTHFGPVSYQIQYDPATSQVIGEATFAENSTAAWATLHIRLPEGLKVKSVNAESKATVLPTGTGIRWTGPQGTMKFQAVVGK
jgi:hypothetical protein